MLGNLYYVHTPVVRAGLNTNKHASLWEWRIGYWFIGQHNDRARYFLTLSIFMTCRRVWGNYPFYLCFYSQVLPAPTFFNRVLLPWNLAVSILMSFYEVCQTSNVHLQRHSKIRITTHSLYVMDDVTRAAQLMWWSRIVTTSNCCADHTISKVGTNYPIYHAR